jgi:chorismate mutase
MSGADHLCEYRSQIDRIDSLLRSLIRKRIQVGRKAAGIRGGGTDITREQEILNRCESQTEQKVFKALFAASKREADVQRTADDGD